MISDNQGVKIDELAAAHRLVVAHDLRFPDAGPGDQVSRVFAEIGKLADAVLTIEQGAPFPMARPGWMLAEAFFSVIRATGCIAHHCQLALRLPNTQGYLRSSNAYVLLGLLTQAGGALAQTVNDQPAGTDTRTASGPASTALGRSVDLVIVRTLVLAEHYGLRHELREVIQHTYRAHQHDGFLP